MHLAMKNNMLVKYFDIHFLIEEKIILDWDENIVIKNQKQLYDLFFDDVYLECDTVKQTFKE
jgi:hypothetical protein